MGGKIGLQVDDATREEVRNLLVTELGISREAASGIILDTEKMFRADYPNFKAILADRLQTAVEFAMSHMLKHGQVTLIDQSTVLSRDDFLEHGRFKPGQEARLKEIMILDLLRTTKLFGTLFYQGLNIHIRDIAIENGLIV